MRQQTHGTAGMLHAAPLQSEHQHGVFVDSKIAIPLIFHLLPTTVKKTEDRSIYNSDHDTLHAPHFDYQKIRTSFQESSQCPLAAKADWKQCRLF